MIDEYMYYLIARNVAQKNIVRDLWRFVHNELLDSFNYQTDNNYNSDDEYDFPSYTKCNSSRKNKFVKSTRIVKEGKSIPLKKRNLPTNKRKDNSKRKAKKISNKQRGFDEKSRVYETVEDNDLKNKDISNINDESIDTKNDYPPPRCFCYYCSGIHGDYYNYDYIDYDC